jgi:hypothetical protein
LGEISLTDFYARVFILALVMSMCYENRKIQNWEGGLLVVCVSSFPHHSLWYIYIRFLALRKAIAFIIQESH